MEAHGLISEETARAMAAAAAGLPLRRGIGTTGIAGTEPVENKPPGTCYVAVAHGDRTEVRTISPPRKSRDVQAILCAVRTRSGSPDARARFRQELTYVQRDQSLVDVLAVPKHHAAPPAPQMWWNRQRRPSFRQGVRPGARPLQYRERGTALNAYSTSRRSWAPVLVMVAALSALETYGYETNLSNTVLRGIGALILVIGVYVAMRIV